MEFLSKYQKKKKSDQQTAVFIKLIVLSYSDVLLSNFFFGSFSVINYCSKKRLSWKLIDQVNDT